MAVVFSDVYYGHQKSIKKNNYVLKGLNMNVPIGCIYGLLGPSGCGKTTLLKCVVGLLKPQSGCVSVFGFKPGDSRAGVPGTGVGYMPQELAVQYDLTIEEILIYFGKINCMDCETIKSETEFLIKTLKLKDKHQFIGDLSGGQKRRVSLAVTMLHKPRLLILDEPTVGVDPILREVIWNLMFNLSSAKKTTIIITTHYIGETKRANVVALMRNGEILEENNPGTLMDEYNSQSLDEVFLNVCCEQQSKQNSNQPSRAKKSSRNIETALQVPMHRAKESDSRIWFKIFLAIVWKYIIETRRNSHSVIMTLITSISVVFTVHVVIGRTPVDLPVAWVVDDVAHNYIGEFNYSSDLKSDVSGDRIVPEDNFADLYLPTIFKQSIDEKMIKLVDYSNVSHALQDAKKRKILAVLYLKSNFSRNYLQRDLVFAETDEFISNETIEQGNIYLHLDFCNTVIAKTIEAVILDSIQKLRNEIAKQFEMNLLLVSPPMVLEPINAEDKPVRTVEDLFSTATFIAPGIVTFNTFAVCVGLSLVTLLTPGECNMFARSYAAGVKATHVVFGQIAARFIFVALNAIFNLLAMVFILDVPCNGSVLLILVLMWLQMLLGITAGILMSVSMSNSFFSFYTSMVFTFILLSTNGVFWGIEAQPYYMKWFTRYSPLHFSVKSLRAVLFYSNAPWSIILAGLFSSVIWIIVFLTAAITVLSFKN